MVVLYLVFDIWRRFLGGRDGYWFQLLALMLMKICVCVVQLNVVFIVLGSIYDYLVVY